MHVSEYLHERLASLHKALADTTRLRIVYLLQELGELCVCDIESALEITQSKASRHLTSLKQAGLAADRRDGTWVYYRLPPAPDATVRSLLKTVRAALREDPAAAKDVERADELRRSPRCGPARPRGARRG